MALHKIKPRLKKYRAANLTKKQKKKKFFCPNFFYETSHTKRQGYSFSKKLNNHRQMKLLFGFGQYYKFVKFLEKVDKVSGIKWYFNKEKLLLIYFERCLGLVLLNSSFFKTFFEVKQVVSHKNVFVNGVRVTNFSFLVTEGDIITFSSKINKKIITNIRTKEHTQNTFSSKHMEINYTNLKIVVTNLTLTKQDIVFYTKYNLNWKELFLRY